MNHRISVFRNSCLKVPVDSVTKMPKTAYERKKNSVTEQLSIDSLSTSGSVSTVDADAEKLKDFYQSIPDYCDINHLSTEQFYSTLKTLREKKKIMLGLAVEHIDECQRHKKIDAKLSVEPEALNSSLKISKSNSKSRENNLNNINDGIVNYRELSPEIIKSTIKDQKYCIINYHTLKDKRLPEKSAESTEQSTSFTTVEKDVFKNKKNNSSNGRIKRNQSACSISWNDSQIDRKNEIDRKFDKFFGDQRSSSLSKADVEDNFKTRSMPSSPLRSKITQSPSRRKSITIPKPFKMTERDEEERMINELRCIQRSFSEDILNRKTERRQFKANPVPIESRIPLYDKILEDQAMRRAITKINSEVELRAKMKPFSFTKREENCISGLCEKATHVLPKTKKKKRFKARPVPKNLFSNYIYDKTREDQFFRNLNRRIRAEEMLKNAHLPGSMANRERSRLSTPAAHSDLPIDPSPTAYSANSSDKPRCSSPIKNRKKSEKVMQKDFITTSPQPFRLSTADRAAKKMLDLTKKIYQGSKSDGSAGTDGVKALSALDLRAASSGRSNLAALLRAEAVRRKFEMEATRRFAEQYRRGEMKLREMKLRSKPAWHLVKNNHEQDIAMRLQTRRDEERMRREEFLHEMELMYGRVQQQPMLFERYYAPRSYSVATDSIQLLPRKAKRSIKAKSQYNSPNRSRKVSINHTAETINDKVADYLNKINDDFSDFVLDCDVGKS